MSDYQQGPLQELRDLADLEALGLLDEIDQRQFERALAEVTVVEQDAIRERQAALVQRLVGEPTEELPEGLKARVCAAIRGEIELHDESLAPLARIGRRRRERNQLGENVGLRRPLIMGAPESALELARVRRSAVIWRAASFALTASLIAAVFFVFHAEKSAEEAVRYASQQAGNEELLRVFGHNLEDLLREDNNEEILGLATAVEQRGSLGVILNKSTNSVKLIALGVAPGNYSIKYQVEGRGTVSVPFQVTGQMGASIVDLALAGAPAGLAQDLLSVKWRVENGEGNVVATCNPSIA